MLLDGLFDSNNKDWLTYFFYVLEENNSSSSISLFHITRYIDYLGAIGNYYGYGIKKYEKVLTDFISDLDENLKKATLNVCRENLLMIKVCQQKGKQLRGWELIGKKLSVFRAYAAHMQKDKKILPFHKAYHVYKIFELIIIDHIFKLLDISDENRLNYKKYYLTRFVEKYLE